MDGHEHILLARVEYKPPGEGSVQRAVRANSILITRSIHTETVSNSYFVPVCDGQKHNVDNINSVRSMSALCWKNTGGERKSCFLIQLFR